MNLQDYIRVFPIADAKECDQIIDKYNSHTHLKTATSATELGAKVLKKHRDCMTMGIEDAVVDKIVWRAYDIYRQMHPLVYCHDITESQFLRYGPGGKFEEHIDSYTEVPRTLSVSIILNDDFTGGEFMFFNKRVVLEAHKGDVIMFPSNFMFPHGVMPVKFGTRFAVVNWLN